LSLGLAQTPCVSGIIGGREVFIGGIGGARGDYVAPKLRGRIGGLVVTGFRCPRGSIGLITIGTRHRARRIRGPRGPPITLQLLPHLYYSD